MTKTRKHKPDFSRVPNEEVKKGVKMLRSGISAMEVMRRLGVSYPTVLKWKRSAVATAAPKIEVVEEDGASPIRRKDVTPRHVVEALTKIVEQGCEVTLARDRDRVIARIADLAHPAGVFAQNTSEPLVLMDAVGKWNRLIIKEAA